MRKLSTILIVLSYLLMMLGAAGGVQSLGGGVVRARDAVVDPPPAVPSVLPDLRLPQRGIASYSYTIVNTYPHDRNAFTQGLLFHNGLLYESTGLYGRSSLRKVDLPTGKVLQQIDVPQQYFAEGLALHKGKLLQLTWQEAVGFVYDLASFNKEKEWNYAGEGWGLTTDQQSLIMSDGTSQIRFLDPDTFAVRRTIDVADCGEAVTNLNELEYINGEIYANVWQTDRVARIDPSNGAVLGWIDFAGLLSPEDRNQPVDVLNGIAYDAASDRLFVTGKLWPKLFEVRLQLSSGRPYKGPLDCAGAGFGPSRYLPVVAN